MAEYIEREAYRDRLADLESWCQDLRKPGLKQALEMFDEVPAADVAPVVHGRWTETDWVEMESGGHDFIKTPKAALRCSNCRNGFKKELLWKTNFCPNCGAKMDGGDNDAAD